MSECPVSSGVRKNGNVDLLVTHVLRGAQSEGARTQRIHVNDLSIKPCQSCGVNPSPKLCLFDGDMRVVYEPLKSCDTVVLGTAAHFDSV